MTSLWRERSGTVAVQVAVTAAALLGAGALAIDLGRAMVLSSQLQNAADAAALAGAAELDGAPGAMVSAQAAIAGAFGANSQSHADDGLGATVAVANVRFLRDATNEAADDTEARFVEVTVQPRSVTSSLIAALAGPKVVTTNARAIAGFMQVACRIPPLMICNPFEATLGVGAPFSATIGQQILVKSQGQGAQWAPGTFGLLDPPTGNTGASAIASFLASANPPNCYGPGVDIRPGQANSVRTALNTRFDMYEAPYFAGAKNNPAYRPARNVTKGMVAGGNPCNPTTASPPQAMALPRDSCLIAGTCERFGDGVWDLAGYWTVNHGGSPPAGVTTRYQAYRWEIDNAAIPNADPATGTTLENGAPQCSGVAPSDNPDRRVLYMAVVNCLEQGIAGNDDDVPAIAYLEAFLTEPVPSAASQVAIYLEVVSVSTMGAMPDILHDMIQLYR
ncbi:MAG: hypothetical protein HQL41_07945 [Alphaproteobacteria bacterium]|nr:hypothetical protein [Alphaproteobacteria bacterium]